MRIRRQSASEKAFQAQVVELAAYLGYESYHPWTSINSRAGYPDLTLWKRGRFLLAELKTERGVLTDAQRQTIASLIEAGVEVHVWRPADLDPDGGKIRDVLMGGRDGV